MRKVLLIAVLIFAPVLAFAGSMLTMGTGVINGGASVFTMLNPIIINPATLPTSGSTTQYTHFGSGDLYSNVTVNASIGAHVQNLAGTFSGLTVALVNGSGVATAPTNPITATVYVNGTTTSYACTITSPATSCSCPVSASCGASPPTVSSGDTAMIAWTSSGWTASQLYGSVAIVKSNPSSGAEWFASTGSSNIGTATQYFGTNNSLSNATESNASSVMPVGGTITGYTVSYSATPTASVYVTSQLCHNGTCGNPCAGWNGTAAVNPCTVTLSQPFSANDTYSIQFVPTGTNNTAQRTAIAYTPNTANQAIFTTSSPTAMNTTNHYYMSMRGVTAPQASTAIPSATFGVIPMNGASVTVSNLTAYEANSVPTRTWTFDAGVLTGGAPTPTSMTCTNSSSSTTIGGSLSWFGCTDNTDTVTFTSGGAQQWTNWDTVGPITSTGSSKISGVAVVTVGGGGGCSNALDFSQACNSQYIPIL